MSRRPFAEQLERGHFTEVAIARALIQGDRYVLLASEFSGKNGDKAPKLFGQSQDLVVPDLMVCDSRKSWWSEIKDYDNPVYHRKSRQWRHGILKRHAEDYQRVECASRLEVYLAIKERSTDKVIVGRLRDLIARSISHCPGEDARKAYGGKELIFFRRASFVWRLRMDSGRVEVATPKEIDAEIEACEVAEPKRYPHLYEQA